MYSVAVFIEAVELLVVSWALYDLSQNQAKNVEHFYVQKAIGQIKHKWGFLWLKPHLRKLSLAYLRMEGEIADKHLKEL